MTTLAWECSLKARPDLMTRLNGASAEQQSHGILIQNLTRALARGGGAHDERVALLRALDGLAVVVDGSSGEPRLRVLEADKDWALALDLIAASSTPFHLRRCFNDGSWFSPALRSARSKFCSSGCRNRFNYELRERRAQFVCVECAQIRDIDAFSGLGLEREHPEPVHVHAAEPLCVSCIGVNHPEWVNYVSSADLLPQDSAVSPSNSTEEYVATLHRLIREVLEDGPGPKPLKKIAGYVTQHASVRGRRPELTILGHLLKFPAQYKQVSKNAFALSEGVHSRSRVEKAEV